MFSIFLPVPLVGSRIDFGSRMNCRPRNTNETTATMNKYRTGLKTAMIARLRYSKGRKVEKPTRQGATLKACDADA
nr:hypothetical protein CFP56_29934 [Quercus suber]